MALDFKCAWSDAEDTSSALEDVCSQIAHPSPSCVFFYCSPKYDLDVLASKINDTYDCPVMACTTAGEILPHLGYVEHGLAAASLSSPDLKVVQEAILDVNMFDNTSAHEMTTELYDRLGGECKPGERRFGLMLIEGLCNKHEFIASTLYGALGGIPIAGGAAGESGQFIETRVLADGQFRRNAAVLTLVQTSLPCLVFKTDHYVPTDTRFVVTGADTENRRLLEIDGISPAEFYLEQTGITRDEFDAVHASKHPLLLPVGSEHYARSVHSTEPDGSMGLFCAIEEGIVMRMGEAMDIMEETERQRKAIEAAVPNHVVTLGFDCFYRQLDVFERDIREPMKKTVESMKLFGFNTYGEQFNGLHVNQTLTGVALGDHA